jgi:hypothetical protein
LFWKGNGFGNLSESLQRWSWAFSLHSACLGLRRCTSLDRSGLQKRKLLWNQKASATSRAELSHGGDCVLLLWLSFYSRQEKTSYREDCERYISRAGIRHSWKDEIIVVAKGRLAGILKRWTFAIRIKILAVYHLTLLQVFDVAKS